MALPQVPAPLMRRLASRYIAGETLDRGASRSIRALAEQRPPGDPRPARRGTSRTSSAGARIAVGGRYEAAADGIAAAVRSLDAYVSVKPTHLGLLVSDHGARARAATRALAATLRGSTGLFLRVEMEDRDHDRRDARECSRRCGASPTTTSGSCSNRGCSARRLGHPTRSRTGSARRAHGEGHLPRARRGRSPTTAPEPDPARPSRSACERLFRTRRARRLRHTRLRLLGVARPRSYARKLGKEGPRSTTSSRCCSACSEAAVANSGSRRRAPRPGLRALRPRLAARTALRRHRARTHELFRHGAQADPVPGVEHGPESPQALSAATCRSAGAGARAGRSEASGVSRILCMRRHVVVSRPGAT